MISHVGTRPTPGLMLLSSFWATIPFMLKAIALRRAGCMSCGNKSRIRPIVVDGAGGVDRSEHQVARFGGVDGRHERFLITHFADEHDVGIFADRVLHADFEVDHVQADLALIDQALVFGEDEFDRVFERENVLAIPVVDPVEHRGDRRALAGAGDAGEQHHALVVSGKAFRSTGGRKRPSKSGTMLFTRRATMPMWPSCCSKFTRNRQMVPSTSSVWAKSAPPSCSKILRFRSFISGKQSRTISSSVIGSRFIGRSVPFTRTIGGLSTFRCKSLALSFTQARNSLSISRSCLRVDEATLECVVFGHGGLDTALLVA